MSTQLTPFEFQGHEVRILPHEDGVSFWAVAKDVTDILGYAEAKDGLRRVPEKHKGRRSVPTPGGNQEMLCVDEAGLYRLILRSDKPEAEPFMEWVTAEMLPAVRRFGYYETPAALRKQLVDHSEENAYLKAENARLTGRVAYLSEQVVELQAFKIAALETELAAVEDKVPVPDMTAQDKAEALAMAEAGVSQAEIARRLGKKYVTIRAFFCRQRKGKRT